MNDLLTPLAPDAVDELWLAVLERRLEHEIRRADPGQCLRLEGLDRHLLETLAARAAGDGAAEVYLVDERSGPEPWRVSAYRVVARRNVGRSVIVALIPPDVKLAAGDSVDVSTFRAIPTDGLWDEAEAWVTADLPAPTLNAARQVLEHLGQKGMTPRPSAVLRFLTTIADQANPEPRTVGAALYTLGLIPDFGLFDEPDQFAHCLSARNLATVEQLLASDRTPLERLLRLDLDDESGAFRRSLGELLDAFDGKGVEAWGETIATTGMWRPLALERWPLARKAPVPGQVRVELDPLKLGRRPGDELPVHDAAEKLTVSWKTDPPPGEAQGLASFRVEVVNADGVVWQSDQIKAVLRKNAKRTKYLKDLGLPSGVYYVRVVPLSEFGDPTGEQPPRDPLLPGGRRTNESDDFWIMTPDELEDELPSAVTATTVGSYPEAEFTARLSLAKEGRNPRDVRPKERVWVTPLEARAETATASIRFDSRRQYNVKLSQRLRLLESAILAQPERAGHRRVSLAPMPAEPVGQEVQDVALPPLLVEARKEIFDAIRLTPVTEINGSGAGGQQRQRPAAPVVALVDLFQIASSVERYAQAYLDWLDSGDPGALLLDVVLTEVDGCPAALLSPTHPLRLLWLLQRQQLAKAWSQAAAKRSGDVTELLKTWRAELPSTGLPPLLLVQEAGEFVEAGELPGGWTVYLPPRLAGSRLADSRAVLSFIDRRTGVTSTSPAAKATADAVAEKLEEFLLQHPYAGTLVINVINPGDAALLVDALVTVEERFGADAPRYELRLFSDTEDPTLVGGALRDLMDPERQPSDAAARLAAPGKSALFPKLAWSRQRVEALTRDPQAFSAHVTLLLDHFPVSLAVARPDPDDRSSFVYGVVQTAPVRFAGHGGAYRWIRRPAPAACQELPGAPTRSELLARLVQAVATAQASVLAPGPGATAAGFAVTELKLATSQQSLLYTVHENSTWVITLDPNLGPDYFDAADQRDRPGYLLDYTPELSPSGRRQLLVTTRAGDELTRLLRPGAERLAPGSERGPKLLLEALRALSGRLPLRLLAAPRHADAALGLALTKLFCEGYGLLTEAIAVPLDAHAELSAGQALPGLQGNLLLVSADPLRRHLDLLVVAATCAARPGGDTDVRARLHVQASAGAVTVRQRFEPPEGDVRVDRQVQSWRLSSVLSFYLDRAERYGLIGPDEAEARRQLLTGLDGGYSLSVRTAGLVFRPDEPATTLDAETPGWPVWLVGRDVLDLLLRAGLRGLAFGEDAGEEPGAAPGIHDVMAGQPTWQRVRAVLASSGEATAPDAGPAEPDLVPASAGLDPAPAPADPTPAPVDPDPADEIPSAPVPPVRETTVDQPAAPAPVTLPAAPTAPAPPPAVHDAPAFDVLLGESSPTPQLGLLGSDAAEDWKRVALDLNGCNTVSVFGVQGGGKSYTLGSILEMAVARIPGVNALPQPLASVVFHYHQTQDYPPEFVSMRRANDDPPAIERLAALGAAPTAVGDVTLLTTADTVDRRRAEFPGVQVEPIAFASSELTVADWRFLMGATDNDSLYLHILNEVMRAHRHDLTLDAIRGGLAKAKLTAAQRSLAETRLEFAARFIDDHRSLRALLVPGRVVIVDLRDEFIERDEALGLFVTMLSVFSGAGAGTQRFNKLIVFDEAHKYLGGPLIGQVVEVVREMRHKGVSLVIASQDPVHVPPEVIELSSAVILHRFNAPSWLKHIQRSLTALSDLTPAMLAGLAPGEAFVWANRATNSVYTRRAVKLRMRPRATKHGGSTRLALGE